VARGWRVGVVAARYPGTAAFEHVAGVEVHRVWAIPKPGRFSATFIPSLARFLLLHGRRYQIWHAHQAFYNAGVALMIARVSGSRCVIKDAASGPYGDLARLRRVRLGGWVRRELRRADAVISLNSEMTQELAAAGIAPERIRRIPNGVDCERFSPPSRARRREARLKIGIAPDALLAVCVGRLAEDKGTGFLIDAWGIVERQCAGQPWMLVFAGEELRAGEYRGRGERQLKTARFVGKLADVRPLLHAADLLVHPSLAEGLSNIVLEAMAVGLPVLGARTGGLEEQIDHGVTGVLVAPRDPDALAAAIIALLRDGGARARMGSAGRLRVVRSYNLNSVLAAYEALYDELSETRALEAQRCGST
jgi:glycosyltransferase involved in cell wall biosynthesis